MSIPRGRAASSNPPNRFERLSFVPDPGEDAPDRVPTEVFIDDSRSVLVDNDSPDVPVERSLNPYRGCAHGCSYCFARQYHEFLGLSCGLDFESKLFAKPSAPRLLREELSRRDYEPKAVALSSATDAWQPIERELRITRACLEVFAEFRHPVAAITKSALIARDADLLGALARHGAASAAVSITTLDGDLQRAMEPRASSPRMRLGAIRALADAGVPVTVNVAPVIPGLTEHEIPAILAAARQAGATAATWIMLRLPWQVKDVFEGWLAERVPLRRGRVLTAMREVHGGALYDAQWGTRMRGRGVRSGQIDRMFRVCHDRLGFATHAELSAAAFRARRGMQLELPL